MSVDPAIKDFERQLDEALESRASLRTGGTDAIVLAANVADVAWAERNLLGAELGEGLEILAPALIAREGGDEVSVPTLVDDLQFAAHYWHVRELLYFTYNAPGSVSWTFSDQRVEISYADDSLPRQFFLVQNNWFLDSLDAFGDRRETARIEGLLRDTPEFELSPRTEQAFSLIEKEAATKFAAYFNLVPDLDAPLDGFSWQELLEVYRCLLVQALYHRYHAAANRSRGAVVMALDDIARDLAASSDLLTEDGARAGVRSMSYGPESRAAGEDPVYFSLYRLPPDDRVVMMPHHFCIWEGFVNLLRLIALRDPQCFLRHFSGPIGRALTTRMASEFEQAGFQCKTEVSLERFSEQLPDIDLLVICEEPTLGYVLLVCEVKAPLPPRWAKDQLRALEPDSVAKAFDQLDRIAEFIATEKGTAFIRDLLPAEGLPHFDEFAAVVHLLAITSDNAGAFFADKQHTIIDFRTLSRLLRRCDGDTLYVLKALHELGAGADRCLARRSVEFRVGATTVQYEGVTVGKLLEFPSVRFRSDDVPGQMVADMLRDGARPLDVLREQGQISNGENG